LVLDPRPDGSGYGSDDLEGVAEIAGPVGRALRVVRVREERATELAAMFAKRNAKQEARLERNQAQLWTLIHG
jgi:hypothetical protein